MSDIGLFVIAGGGILLIIFLITVLKIHPFVALLGGSALIGLATGLSASEAIESIVDGAGSTMGGVGLLIAIGAMLSKLLADSGGADQIAETITSRVSPRAMPWAMALISFLLGVPLFFDVGVVLLIPIALLVAKRTGQPPMLIALPALTSLSLLNGFLVPSPGPLIAVAGFDADIGLSLLVGGLISIPTIIVGGPLFAKFIAPRVSVSPPAGLMSDTSGVGTAARTPRFGWTLLTLLLPVVLMLAHTLAQLVLGEGHPIMSVTGVVGEPIVALFLGLVAAIFTLGFGSGMDLTRISSTMGAGLPAIAGIILITGGGGGLAGILESTGIGVAIGELAENSGMPLLILAWLMAAIIRVAVGSGTVAIVTTVGLLGSAATDLDALGAVLLALSVGAGSRFLSHVNDSGFWLVKEYLGMDVKDTLKSWSVMDCIIAVVALLGILVVDVMT